jgi:hypothetical protein
MHMRVFLKAMLKIAFPALFLASCTYLQTQSGPVKHNRNIEVTVLSGNAYIEISGHISADIYADYRNDFHPERDTKTDAIQTPVVTQGQETINTEIALHETQKFKYTLTAAEVVIMNIRSIDGNDVKIAVFEYGENRKYTVDGKNKLGKIISFSN